MAYSASASGSMTSYWIKFFKDSGIPAGESTNYAITFTDNRISQAMLLDLNKEYLNDMGITVLGDVIAILKHSKVIHAQETAKERAQRAANIATPSTPQRSTPASRTVNHYLGSTPDSAPMNAPTKPGPKMSKELAARLGPTPEAGPPVAKRIRLSSKPPEAPSSKVRRVLPEHEGRYKIIMPQGTTERSRKALEQQAAVARPQVKSGTTSVFGRLGAEAPAEGSTITVTGLGTVVKSKGIAQDSSSVFARLGTTVKRAATSTSMPQEEEDEEEEESHGVSPVLEYAGVFKLDANTKAREKKMVIEHKRKALLLRKKQLEASKASIEQRLGPQRMEVSTTAGILSINARPEQLNIRNRLGKTVVSAASSTSTVSSSTHTKASGVHVRLGRLADASSSARTGSLKTGSGIKPGAGVFKRLGKPVL